MPRAQFEGARSMQEPDCPPGLRTWLAGRKVETMPQGFGPHGVVSLAELVITFTVLVLGLTAVVYMGFRTRRRPHPH
jgi:hypothetical protein